jgi:adenylate cyclase
VIARNSSFSHWRKSSDTRRVARELGVRYVLEGSIRLLLLTSYRTLR